MKPREEEDEEEYPSEPVALALKEAHALVLSCSHHTMDQEKGSQVTKLDCSTNGGRVEARVEEPSDVTRGERTRATAEGPQVLERQTRSSIILETATVEESGGSWSGREKLKKHRMEVAGKVWIPETWGQEKLLKDWIDCSAFDASLISTSSARDALVQQGLSTCKTPPLIPGD